MIVYVVWVTLFVSWNALCPPLEDEAGVIVTSVPRVPEFPYGSSRVAMMSADSEPAVEELVDDVNAILLGAAAETVTVSRSLPLEAEIAPSVTAMFAVSTLYNTIEPTPPAVLETPAVNVFVVVDPNATADGVLLVTVGAVTGFDELFAPLNVKFFEPE